MQPFLLLTWTEGRYLYILNSHRTIFIYYCTATGWYLYIIVQSQDDIYTLLYSHRTIIIYYCTVTGWYYILLYSHRMIFIHYCTATGRYLYIIVQPQDDINILLYSQRQIFMGLYSNEMRIISMMRRIEVFYKLTSNIKEIWIYII